ncbi:MAG: GDSL-type esterase/lipase family protein [Acidimicrobiales bacterium]
MANQDFESRHGVSTLAARRLSRRRGCGRNSMTPIRGQSLIVRVVALLVTVIGWAATSNAPVSAAASAAPAWQTTWTSPTDLGVGVTSNSTTRDIATVAVGGSSLKFTFSNLWSMTPTTFSAVTVGVQQSGATVTPGTFIPVTFNNSPSVTIAPQSRVTSDPVAMTVHAGESLAISIAVSGSATVSVHYCCQGRVDSYATDNGAGNLTQIASSPQFDPRLPNWTMRWLSAIAVGGSPAQGTIVAFGDSITDGYGYTNNSFSWVDALQSRISQLPANQQMSVVNEGIAANTLTAFPPHFSFDKTGGGLPGVTRLENDALTLPGVKAVVLLLGTNDIWFGAGGRSVHPIPPYGTAPSIEAGMRQIIAATHARGIKVYGITLLPRATSTTADHDLPENWWPSEQAILSAVNTWMLSPGSGFDGVLNLNAVMANVYNGSCQSTTPFAPYFNPDHLHPNIAGQTAIANAIPTTLFDLPEAPQLPPLVSVTPTANCAAAQLAAQVFAAGTTPGTTTTTSTTTTVPATTTTQAPGLLGGHARTFAEYLLILLIALTLVMLGVARRRAIRRRAIRRRSSWHPDYPRTGPPQRRPPPPPRKGPPPRR